MDTQKYIVRGRDSGVYYGEIETRTQQEVTMKNARCLWYWEGAASLLQLAKDGVARPNACKFTVYLDTLTILDAVCILPCSKEAIYSIESVREWSA